MAKLTILGLGFCMLVGAMAAQAAVITFSTPPGSTTGGGAVSANATFLAGPNSLFITITDQQANPANIAQLVSGLSFTLSNGANTGALSFSYAPQITVNAGGTSTPRSTSSTGWGLNNNVSGGLQLTALGYVGPAGLIIGPPGSGGYTSANSSIAANGPHNPFINQTATFSLSFAPGLGVTSSTTVTSATFFFGTTPGVDVVGCLSTGSTCSGGNLTTSEPMSLILAGTGLIGFYFIRRRRTGVSPG